MSDAKSQHTCETRVQALHGSYQECQTYKLQWNRQINCFQVFKNCCEMCLRKCSLFIRDNLMHYWKSDVLVLFAIQYMGGRIFCVFWKWYFSRGVHLHVRFIFYTLYISCWMWNEPRSVNASTILAAGGHFYLSWHLLMNMMIRARNNAPTHSSTSEIYGKIMVPWLNSTYCNWHFQGMMSPKYLPQIAVFAGSFSQITTKYGQLPDMQP